MKEQQHTTRRLSMKIFRSMALTAVAVSAFGLTGCGSSGSDPIVTLPTGKTVTINGSLEPGAAKLPLKAVESATSSIGTVTAIDAATGAVISTAPADILPGTNSGGTF